MPSVTTGAAVVTEPMPSLIRHHDLSDVGERWEQEAQLAAVDPWTAVQRDHRGTTIDGLAISRNRAFKRLADRLLPWKVSDGTRTHDRLDHK